MCTILYIVYFRMKEIEKGFLKKQIIWKLLTLVVVSNELMVPYSH